MGHEEEARCRSAVRALLLLEVSVRFPSSPDNISLVFYKRQNHIQKSKKKHKKKTKKKREKKTKTKTKMEPDEQQPLPRKGALTRRLRYWLQLCKNVWAQKIFGEEEFKNGRGTYGWSNGNKYEGEWKEDHRHGRGRMIYADGDKYEGI